MLVFSEDSCEERLSLDMMAECISNALRDTGSVVMAVDYSGHSEWAFDCEYLGFISTSLNVYQNKNICTKVV